MSGRRKNRLLDKEEKEEEEEEKKKYSLLRSSCSGDDETVAGVEFPCLEPVQQEQAHRVHKSVGEFLARAINF